MDELTPDLCVIGAGSAGLSVAAGAVQMGASVVLVEEGEMGGDCLNDGCVPSKALLAAGKAAHAMGAGAPFGVTPVAPEIDFAAAKDHVRRVIESIAPVDSQERFEGLGCTVLRARARFTGPKEVVVGGVTVRARRFVVATGSSPFVPPIPGLEEAGYYTNETIFDLRERPAHLLIVGGGPIGLEMAQAHRRLGCAVTVLEAERALGKDDADCAALVLSALRGEGIVIREGAKVSRAAKDGDGAALTLETGETLRGDAVLVAVGRRPSIDDMGLAEAGIETENGSIKVDSGLRTTNRRVYAIGDVAGGLQFTHVAGYQAGLVVRSALFRLPVKNRTDHIPWCTYTDPELAQVGLTEAEARKAHGDKVEVYRAEYDENDRARAELATCGLTKAIFVKGKPVGATIVGKGAGDLISIWALAISKGLSAGDLAGFVAPYPTYGELAKRAAGAYYTPRLFENPWVKRVVRLLAKLG